MQQRIARLKNKPAYNTVFKILLVKVRLIKHAIELAEKVAATDTTVSVPAKPAPAKKFLPKASIMQVAGKTKSFVAVNCTAISKDLLESELFGYKAGAFTGATKDKKGLWKKPMKGPCFLMK